MKKKGKIKYIRCGGPYMSDAVKQKDNEWMSIKLANKIYM